MKWKRSVKVSYMEDGTGIPLWGCIIFILLIIINGAFYGFSAALQNLSPAELDKQVREGNKKAAGIEKIKGNTRMLANSIPILTSLTGICLGTFLVPQMAHSLRNYMFKEAATILLILAAVILLAAFGTLVFRRIGTFYPEKIAYRFVNLVRFCVWVFMPLTWIVTLLTNLTVRLFGVDPHKVREDLTEEEIMSVVGEAHEQGVIEQNEAEMIQNIISFNETEAQDVMTHRKEIIGFDVKRTLGEAMEVMLEEGNSRYPVYEEDLDNIIGLIHYKDVMGIVARNEKAKEKPISEIAGLIRQISFIPETRGIGNIFKSMQAKKIHIAVVVDEYGQTSGLVTMEDILEEIVGDILDEYDEDETFIRPLVDNSILMEGLTPLEDVEEELQISFGDSEFETLNGYLTSILGHIPTQDDEEVLANGYRFQILSIDKNTIGKVRVEKLKETKGEEKICQDIQNSQI